MFTKRENLTDSFAGLKAMQWYSGPSLASMDLTKQRAYYYFADLVARLCLNSESHRLKDEGNPQAACMLVHAERYLADRLAYELAPWPKNKIKLEPDDAYALPPKANID